ncbi:MAG: DNA replication/repair protein RecF [Oscillospiraceae bacterium]|nr:DNA replication/repair protein RecF [Oscillospiraceae bacterium]
MYIEKIKLINFRNYIEQEIELNKRINIFYGDNAQGKTNILEAIYMCSIGKSFRKKREKEIINFNKENLMVEINYIKKEINNNKIKLEINNNKKIFYLNKIKIKKLSEILGNINIVIFNPDDINILKGPARNRRKFLDIMISQLKIKYIYNLTQYLKILEQRNNYLRQIKYENKELNIIEIWNEQLAEHAEIIFNFRKEFINKINNKINNIHNKITENKENIILEYISNFENKNNYLVNLKNNINEDIKKGYTTVGIHRDDFNLFINNKKIDIYGSQGQHRSAILSLKITEAEIIYEEIEEYPIILLDDFMSELDNKRKNNFLENIKNNQIIITCTDKIEKDNSKVFNVKEGKVLEEQWKE